MAFLFYFLIFLWFIKTTRVVLFYLYLWQLKDYHIGRFLAHFQTDKGKRLIFNKVNLVKFLILFFISPFILYLKFGSLNSAKSLFFIVYGFIILGFIIFFLYILETVKTFTDIILCREKKPVLTKKALFLMVSILLAEVFVFLLISSFASKSGFLFLLLLTDLFFPAIISLVVVVFQPITVLLRYRILNKAKKKRERFRNLTVIGITGSYGKTTVKEILAMILAEKFKVLKTKEHQNSEIGISQCILNELKPEYEIFVVEMGSYGRGGIKLLCDIARPKIGILTGINEQHLALYGSQEKIIDTKFELIGSLPEDGVAIVNGDNALINSKLKTQSAKPQLKTQKCSARNKADVWAEDVRVDREWVSFKAFSKEGDSVDFKVNIFGGQNVENILLAVACAKELGISFKEISEACKKIKPEQGGIKIIKPRENLTIIDSSYSSNSTGVLADLDYLNIYAGRKIIIMPCLIELGKVSKEVHYRIGKKIAKVCNLAIITTKDRFEDLKKGSVSEGMEEERIMFCENSQKIVEIINKFSQEKITVLLEGRVPKEIIGVLK